jgi:hypothetical protein
MRFNFLQMLAGAASISSALDVKHTRRSAGKDLL